MEKGTHIATEKILLNINIGSFFLLQSICERLAVCLSLHHCLMNTAVGFSSQLDDNEYRMELFRIWIIDQNMVEIIAKCVIRLKSFLAIVVLVYYIHRNVGQRN